MSGPLGVTHMLVFSQPAAPRLVDNPATKNQDESPEARADRALVEGTSSLNLRLIRLPRGPTLSFKVLRYSLAADVLRMARRPRSIGREFAESPMVSQQSCFARLQERGGVHQADAEWIGLFLVDLVGLWWRGQAAQAYDYSLPELVPSDPRPDCRLPPSFSLCSISLIAN